MTELALSDWHPRGWTNRGTSNCNEKQLGKLPYTELFKHAYFITQCSLSHSLLFISHFCKFWCFPGKSRWSPGFLSQVRDLSCEPGEVRNNVTFLHGTKSGNFTKLGKVSDLEVCMLLCCELDRCQAAFLAGKNCYSVTCFTDNHCATAPALNNKWQPVVAFVKRLHKAVHVEAGRIFFTTILKFSFWPFFLRKTTRVWNYSADCPLNFLFEILSSP